MHSTTIAPANQEDYDGSGLVCVADLDKLDAVRFIFRKDELPVRIRIECRDPLLVSIARRLDDNTAKRDYWTAPAKYTDKLDALGALLWHINNPAAAGWLRAYGERLGSQGGA